MSRKILFALLAALAAGPALAHDDATLDAMASPHGGQTRMAGAYHFELVLDKKAAAGRPSSVRVFLSDHGGAAVPAKGLSATATLLGPGGKHSLRLEPDGPSSLGGSAVYQADPALKAVVSLTFPDGRVEQARFEPFKSARVAAVKSGEERRP